MLLEFIIEQVAIANQFVGFATKGAFGERNSFFNFAGVGGFAIEGGAQIRRTQDQQRIAEGLLLCGDDGLFRFRRVAGQVKKFVNAPHAALEAFQIGENFQGLLIHHPPAHGVKLRLEVVTGIGGPFRVFRQRVPQIVWLRLRVAFGVQAVSVGLHLVKPDLFGAGRLARFRAGRFLRFRVGRFPRF